MAKRNNAPDEALGPAVNGLEGIDYSIFNKNQPEAVSVDEEVDETEEIFEEPAVVLLCGYGEHARETALLAKNCGFEIRQAQLPDEAALPEADIINLNSDLDDFIEACAIDRNYFICIFWENEYYCETALAACLNSDARYIGLWANKEKRDEIYNCLREDGAPDTELAAICSPMGLNIGAINPRQAAVGIVAELLAAQSGTLKRLRHED